MKSTRTIVLFLCFILGFLVLTSGCQEAAKVESVEARRARLVGEENITLKQEVQKQKDLVTKCEALNVKIIEDSRGGLQTIMTLLAETSTKAETALKENTELKAQIAELNNQLNRNEEEKQDETAEIETDLSAE